MTLKTLHKNPDHASKHTDELFKHKRFIWRGR